MHHKYGHWQRYWSLATTLGLPLMVFFFLDRDETRAIMSIACMILLIHSWFMQRRYTQNRSHLLFWTVVLFLPMLGATWLGLNVIRADTYHYFLYLESEVQWENADSRGIGRTSEGETPLRPLLLRSSAPFR